MSLQQPPVFNQRGAQQQPDGGRIQTFFSPDRGRIQTFFSPERRPLPRDEGFDLTECCGEAVALDLQLVAALQVEPEPLARAEVAGEA